MDSIQIFEALILGVIEGLTEFIPVSSTGHLILARDLMGFKSTGNTFEVLIQLGAVLAVLSVYFGKLWHLVTTLPSSPRSRHFITGILVAFLPAVVIGVIAHDFIKEVLFETPMVICVALLLGGIALLIIDRIPREPRYTDIESYPLSLCLKIGLFQCLAMIPGTSRSGSTIAGALLLGTDKRSAAEFSFFLAMPTMAGAFAFDLLKNYKSLNSADAVTIGVGFVMAFLSALVVVRSLLSFVSRYGFAPFAWWRIVVGSIGIGVLLALR